MSGSTSLTATFLFTDIEGISRLWENDAGRMRAALAIHDDILRKAIGARSGNVFKRTGDGACAAFGSAVDALMAAVDAQRLLHEEEWDLATSLRVRMGLHVGEVEYRDDDYYGVAVNRVGRLHALASGGQIIVSTAVRAVLHGSLPTDVELVDLGEVELRGMAGRERVFQVTHPDLPGSFPPLASAVRDGNVPVPATDMIGRDREVGQVLGLLGLGPLVTITGFGGVGKSRLALAAAPAARDYFPDGAWWIELAPVSGDAVFETAALALGAHRQGVSALDSVIDRLRRDRALVLLDNCEHVLEHARVLVEAILAQCPDITVLATSRAPLNLAGERTLALRPLGAPAPDDSFDRIVASPSIELFEQRAREIDPDFSVTPENGHAIAEICARLDGLPLAIELAAARTRSMSPSEVLSRLDARFRLLRGRERGLAQVVEWSYDLLSAEEQVLFEQLSTFRGRFSAAAAIAVADPALDELDVLDLLDALVAQSLVDAMASSTATGYSVLETLRAFGRDRLDARGTAPEVHQRLREHFVEFAEQAAIGITGPDEATWVTRIDDAIADVRAAFEQALTAADVDTCMRMVIALAPYAFWRLRVELADWAAAALSLPVAAEHPAFDDTAGVAAGLCWGRGDMASAVRYCEMGRPASESTSWYLADSRGTVAMFQGKVDDAIDAYQRASDRAVVSGNTYALALSRSREALAHLYAGLDDVHDLAASSEEAATITGNPTAQCVALWTIAIAEANHDRPSALIHLNRSLELAESVGNVISAGTASELITQLHARLERQSALERLREAIDQIAYWAQSGTVSIQWGMVRKAVRALVAAERFEDAAVVAGSEAAAAAKMPVHTGEADRYSRALDHVRATIGDDAFARSLSEGALLDEAGLITRLRQAAQAAT